MNQANLDALICQWVSLGHAWRAVLADNELTAVGFFNEAKDRAGYFAKCHGLIPYHDVIERKPPNIAMRQRHNIGYWGEQAQRKSNRRGIFIGRLILEDG